MKWHFPVGLLYDLYSGASEQVRDAQDNERNTGAYTSAEEPGNTHGPRVWKLTLHFENWPKESLAHLDSEGKVMRDAFTNSVKEVGRSA